MQGPRVRTRYAGVERPPAGVATACIVPPLSCAGERRRALRRRRPPRLLLLIGLLLAVALVSAAPVVAYPSGPEAGFGNGLSFGQGYLLAPLSSSVAFSGASDFTIEMWVRPDDVSAGFVNLARQKGAVGTLQTWFLLAPGNHICFGLDNYNNGGWYWSARDAEPLPAGVWSHVAFVKDGDHGRIYVDGALILDEGFAGYACLRAAASGAPFEFGADSADPDGNPLNGDLDEIQIYDRPLSGADLAAVYNRGPGQSLPLTPSTGPLRYYRLDESSGTTAADSGSDGVEATLTDMPGDSWTESYAGRDFLSAEGDAVPVGLAYGDVSTAALTVAVVDQPEHGDVDLTAPTLGQGTYTPDAGWSGFETFTYTVSDGTTTTPAQTAYVTAYTVDTHTWTGLGGDSMWSTAANWDLGVPSDGDSVIVKSSLDDIPTLRLKDVTLVGDASGSCSVSYVYPVPLTVTGTLDSTCLVGDWCVPIAIGNSTTLASAGTLNMSGEISGGDALGALTVDGPGAVSFTYWTANTYAGATHVAGGVLTVKRGVLPPGSPVSITQGATFQYLGDGMPDSWIDVLDNVFSGPAGAQVKFSQIASVMLTGDSSSFGGATTVEASEDYGTSELSVSGALGGTLGGGGWTGGSGSVGALAPDAHLWVGFAGHWTGIGVSTLFTGPTEMGDGGAYRWDLTDAEGTPGSGGDLLAVSGDLQVSASGGGFTIIPVTCNSGDFGECANFDPTKAYRWPLVAADSISGFRPAAFRVDTSMFLNDTMYGAFSVEEGTYDGRPSLDLVFTPAPGIATWTGSGTSALWSDAGNWEGGQVPADGDALVFPLSATRKHGTNDLLSSAAALDVYGGDYGSYTIDGDALTLRGELALGSNAEWLVDKTTLGTDVTLRQVPDPEGTTQPVVMSGDIDLVDGSGDGHTFTVDLEDWRSRVCHSGRLTGSEEECGLVVQGNPEGVLLLGHGPGLEPWDRRGNGWTGPNTWAGPTVLRNGSVWILSPGALSQHTSSVHIVDESWSPTTLVASFPSAEATDTWNNTFTGDGLIEISQGQVTFTGSSPAFAGTLRDASQATLAVGAVMGGTADVVDGGTLYGLGTFEALAVDSGGTLNAGLAEFGVGTLAASGEVAWNEGGTFVVDVRDEGTGLAHDLLTIGGDAPGLTVASTEATPFTIALVSSDGTSAAPCANFNSRRPYRWHVATLSAGGISGWTRLGAVQVDATRFAAQNELDGGTFSAEPSTDASSVDVLFTPAVAPDQPDSDFGDALAFGEGYLSAPNSSSIAFSGAEDYTVEMWVRPQSGATHPQTLFRQRDGGPDTLESWIYLGGGRQLYAGIVNGAAWAWTGAGTVLPADVWSHVALVKQGTDLKLYLNGVLNGTKDFSGQPELTGAGPNGAIATFGEGTTAEGFVLHGDLDEIQMYDRALLADELAAVWNRGPGQSLTLDPATGPVRYYRLDEGSGTSAADSGSDGIAATLHDMSADPWIESTAGRTLYSATGGIVDAGVAYGDPSVKDLTVAIVDQPAHGTIDLFSAERGQGTYRPTPGWTGTESFTYTVSDGTTTTPEQTATVTSAGVTNTYTGPLGGAWSEAANWDVGRPPQDGDNVVAYASVDDIPSLTLGDVKLIAHAFEYSGVSAAPGASVTIDGTLRIAALFYYWAVPTTLGPGASVRADAMGSVTAPLTGGDAAGTVSFRGGYLTVSVPAGQANSYAGGTSVAGGVVEMYDGALPAGSAVDIAGDASLFITTSAGTTSSYDNTIGGPAGAALRISGGTVVYTGDGSGFSGTVDVLSQLIVPAALSGTFKGSGTVSGGGVVGALGDPAGAGAPRIWPSYAGEGNAAVVAGLSATGYSAGAGPDATAAFDCGIADATAGAGTGNDVLYVYGDVDLTNLAGAGFTVAPRTYADDGFPGECADFDPGQSYRWPFLSASGTVSGFDAAKFTVDPQYFANDTAGGTFSVESAPSGTGTDLVLVFTPAAAGTLTWTGGGATSAWSDAGNWDAGRAPKDGDSLVFPQSAYTTPENDIGGLTLADVGFSGPDDYQVTGEPVSVEGTMTASMTGDATVARWDLPTELSAGTHTFAVSAGILRLSAVLTGGAADEDVITKTGAGTLQLDGAAGYDGDVAILEGVLDLTTPPAVPATADVDVSSGATLAVSFDTRGEPATLGGTLSGPSDSRLELNDNATLLLAGDPSGFSGTTSVAGSGPEIGVLRIGDGVAFGGSLTGGGAVSGQGSIPAFGDITTVFPGLAGWLPVKGTYPALEVGMLHSATTTWSPLTRLAVTMTDASGAAGTGYDQVQVDGDLTIPADGVVTVGPVTSAAGTVGECAGFDQYTSYRWHVVRVSGAIGGFDGATLDVPTGSFLNAYSGAFGLEQGTVKVGDTTYQTIDLVYTPPVFSGPPAVAGSVASFSVGTTQTVTWETNEPMDAGTFDVVAVDAGSVETTVVAGVPADGTASYAATWTVVQKAASGWRVKIVYHGAGDVPSAKSTAFRIANPALTVTAPLTGSSWSRNTTQTVSWTTTPALAAGSFRAWATPAAGGTTRSVSATVVPVVAGQTAYELPCRWTLPSGLWKLSVYYYVSGSAFTCQNSVKVQVTVPAVYTITSSKGTGGTISPLGATSVEAGADQSYTITPTAGYHVADVLVDGASAGAVTSYEFTAVDRDHTIAASFVKNPGIVVTAPGEGASWTRGTTETVSWTVAPALTVGSFRVWATPAAGGTTRSVSTTVVPVVPGQKDYGLDCRWTLPTGLWKLSVYYYAFGTTFTSQNAVKPQVTVPEGYVITSSKGTGGTISPLGVTYLLAGADQSYTITPVSGYHVKDVVVDSASVGATSTWQFTNVTSDHTIAAAFEKNPQIAVTAPADGSTWSRGTTETVSWTLSPTLTVGSFRVWATPAAGGTTRAVSTTVVPVVPLQTAYSLDCRMALTSGDWKLSVYYYASGTTFTSQNAVRPVVHVP